MNQWCPIPFQHKRWKKKGRKENTLPVGFPFSFLFEDARARVTRNRRPVVSEGLKLVRPEPRGSEVGRVFPSLIYVGMPCLCVPGRGASAVPREPSSEALKSTPLRRLDRRGRADNVCASRLLSIMLFHSAPGLADVPVKCEKKGEEKREEKKGKPRANGCDERERVISPASCLSSAPLTVGDSQANGCSK